MSLVTRVVGRTYFDSAASSEVARHEHRTQREARAKASHEEIGSRGRFAAYEEAAYKRSLGLVKAILEKQQAKAKEVSLRREEFKTLLH